MEIRFKRCLLNCQISFLFPFPAICLSKLLKYYSPSSIIYYISSISSLRFLKTLFPIFFSNFLEFFSLLKFPHSYNSTCFSRSRITAEQDCERINSNFGNVQE